jgi:hypothetical protein
MLWGACAEGYCKAFQISKNKRILLQTIYEPDNKLMN